MDEVIRDAVPSDVYGIREVQRVAWLDTYPNEKVGITTADINSKFEDDDTPEGRKRIEERRISINADPSRKHIVVTVGDKIIGFCICIKEEKSNRIQAIYALPGYQGKGIGKRLIDSAFEWLGSDKDIYVNVASYNIGAIGFYKHMGFIETGREEVLDSVAKLPTGKVIPETEMVRESK